MGDRRVTTIRLINAGGSVEFVRGDRTGSVCRASTKKKGRIAAFMYANQLFIQHIAKTRERGERDGTRVRQEGPGGGEAARGRRECNSKRE